MPTIQRFSRRFPCVICGGGEDDPRGQQKRCTGFLSSTGKTAWCSREEFAGALILDAKKDPPAYGHRMEGPCGCGEQHGQRSEPLRTAAAVKRHVTATYVYRDEQGTPLFRVIRLEPEGGGEKTFRQQSADGKSWGRGGARLVPYRLPELLAQPNRGIVVCFAPDTEVLTPGGWMALPDLDTDSLVAQFAPLHRSHGEIEFVQPTAYWSVPFTGDLIHQRADFSDLLVTPDHRTLLHPRRWKVARADAVRRGARLPVAGFRSTDATTPTATEARLMAAWQADGVNTRRGHRVAWNLKRQRKIDQLHWLLDSLSIPYRDQRFASTPGWTVRHRGSPRCAGAALAA